MLMSGPTVGIKRTRTTGEHQEKSYRKSNPALVGVVKPVSISTTTMVRGVEEIITETKATIE